MFGASIRTEHGLASDRAGVQWPLIPRLTATGVLRGGARGCFMLSGVRPRGYPACMNAVTLPPDLERIAADMVAQWRYADLDDVVRAGIGLLQRAEAERRAFIASLYEAMAEGDRDGFSTMDEVLAEMDGIIEDMARARSQP